MIQFKEMPTKAQMKTYITDRIQHINKNPKIRIITYNNDFLIYEVITESDIMQFCPSFALVQSVNFRTKAVIYTVTNDIYGYKIIIDEIDYFNRNPAEAIKKNYNLINLK